MNLQVKFNRYPVIFSLYGSAAVRRTNFDYLHMGFGWPTLLLVPADGESVLITPVLDAGMAFDHARVGRELPTLFTRAVGCSASTNSGTFNEPSIIRDSHSTK